MPFQGQANVPRGQADAGAEFCLTLEGAEAAQPPGVRALAGSWKEFLEQLPGQYLDQMFHYSQGGAGRPPNASGQPHPKSRKMNSTE